MHHLQQSFAISPTDLKDRYKSLMMELHPDRHSGNNSDKDSKAAGATQVTHAYDVLANPLSRALHLLELNGSSIDEGDAVSDTLVVLAFLFYAVEKM